MSEIYGEVFPGKYVIKNSDGQVLKRGVSIPNSIFKANNAAIKEGKRLAAQITQKRLENLKKGEELNKVTFTRTYFGRRS